MNSDEDLVEDDDSVGDILFDLFQKGTHGDRLFACRQVLEVIPEESRLKEVRRKFARLLEDAPPPEQLTSEIERLDRELSGVLDGPGQMSLPFRCLGLLIDFWLADTRAFSYSCGEWIDEFLDLLHVDMEDLVEELPRARPD